jgi:hypothetical protein
VESASRSSRQPEERPWLKEKVYDPRRSRTVELVKSSVGSLMKDGKRISLAALSARSKEIDPDRRGISESAILKNQEARLCYEQHRSWKASSRNGTRTLKPHCVTVTAGIKRDRDTARVRYRYLKWSKADLVARLVAVENAHAALQERWVEVNEEVLRWRLRAEQAESQLRRGPKA